MSEKSIDSGGRRFRAEISLDCFFVIFFIGPLLVHKTSSRAATLAGPKSFGLFPVYRVAGKCAPPQEATLPRFPPSSIVLHQPMSGRGRSRPTDRRRLTLPCRSSGHVFARSIGSSTRSIRNPCTYSLVCTDSGVKPPSERETVVR